MKFTVMTRNVSRPEQVLVITTVNAKTATEARRMKYAKTYIDIKTGKAHSDNYTLQCRVEEIMNEISKE